MCKKNPNGETHGFGAALPIVTNIGVSILGPVPACGGDFGALVQRCIRVCTQDGELLAEAEITSLLAALVRVGFCMDAPLDAVLLVLVL